MREPHLKSDRVCLALNISKNTRIIIVEIFLFCFGFFSGGVHSPVIHRYYRFLTMVLLLSQPNRSTNRKQNVSLLNFFYKQKLKRRRIINNIHKTTHTGIIGYLNINKHRIVIIGDDRKTNTKTKFLKNLYMIRSSICCCHYLNIIIIKNDDG